MSLTINTKNVGCEYCKSLHHPCPIGEAIGFLAMAVDLMEVKPAGDKVSAWQEWYKRSLIWHWAVYTGYSSSERPFELSPMDFRRHIGLRVNVVKRTRTQFMRKVDDVLFENATKALRQNAEEVV